MVFCCGSLSMLIQMNYYALASQFVFDVTFLHLLSYVSLHWGFPGSSDGKEPICNAGDPGLIPQGEWLHTPAVVVQCLSHAQLFVTPRTAARQTSLSFTVSWSLLKLMPIESVMLSNHLILCRPLLLPSIFPSLRVFSNESAL